MSSSPMKARSPHSSVVMDETVPLLQIKDLNVNLQRFRVLAKISMLGPVMKNDSGKQADILHFRLLDSTGEISASVHSFMTENWIKYLTLDKTFMFQAKKDVRYPSFEVIKKDEATEELFINFNFLSKVKPMYNVHMPDIGYSNLIKVTSSDPNSCFNSVVEINDCLPSNGPNTEYDVMQQQFKIQDHTKADIDMIVKGNVLVPRMKTFKPKNERRMIVRILHGQLEKMHPEVDDGENAESEITIIVDQKKSNIEVLEDSSPLKISFLAKNSAFKRGHNSSDEDEGKATPEKKTK